jgi:hypothetical protein
VYLSRVTWLVFGTALVLVSAVLVAAVVFINGSGTTFPSGGRSQSGGVVRVHPPRTEAGGRNGGARNGGGRTRLTASAGGRQVAAHPASAGLTATLVGAPPGSGAPTPGTPPGDQYGGRLQQLKSALGP